MLFDSPVYILFLVLVTLAYWRLRFRTQNHVLLAASYFFYGWWDYRFLSLMAISTVVDYTIAHRIAATANPLKRRGLLTVSLLLNFSFLGFFKYFNFFVDSFGDMAAMLGMHDIPKGMLQIILPPGISFYTFQAVAYIVDVYHRKIEPADSFVDYALFISLFPHLIAGPIQRPSHLLPQVQRPRFWDTSKSFDGVMLILEGLFRKCVIADNCALIANGAFGGQFGGPNLFVLLLGMYAFAWQIYGDFSGYSSIARGSAQLLGFHFMVNFRQPYLACSLQDFWRRWHISLSTWLRDYLYIPLGGNRHGEAKTYRNLLVTMLLGGLWHGANWTFVVWGGIHGLWLSLERVWKVTEAQPPGMAGAWLRRILLFHVVGVTWIFFRALSLGAAWRMLAGAAVWEWRPEYFAAFKFLAVFAAPLLLIDLLIEKFGGEYALASHPLPRRVAAGFASFALIALFGANEANTFIYFQF